MTDDYEVGYGKPPQHTRWPKGRSPNPAGRPKGQGITDRLWVILFETDGDGVTVAERLVRAGVDAAMNGDFRFWSAIVNRIDGKVTDQIEQQDKVEVVLRYVDESPSRLDHIEGNESDWGTSPFNHDDDT